MESKKEGEGWMYDESKRRGDEGLVGWCRGENEGIREEGEVEDDQIFFFFEFLISTWTP